ncbi:MAG: DUF3488 and transglutaminase-like domain-containing protein [Acidobacteriota bacterium]|nr:DUF3488 and transglutaminase-like domain-containing protein [Acidobacteriota bacterium]
MSTGPPAAAEIPFLKERLLALGGLAFLAPVPLFFANALELAVLLAYLGVLALLLARVRRGSVPRLGNRVLNLAGLLYVPIIFLDVRFGSQTLLKTMLHLLLFTTLFKLAAIRKERDLSLALVLSGLLFVASVSTSFHYAILLYVLLMAFAGWSVLVKWALWRDLSGAPEEWSRDRTARSLPGRGPLVTSVLSTVLLAIPLFLFLPRLKAPYVRGAEAGREITTGFSESVDPDLFGALKQSDRVFLRITSEEALGGGDAAVLRLRTLALSRWENGVWKKPPDRSAAGARSGFGALVPLAPRGAGGGTAMTIDLTPIQTRYLPYPLLGNALRLSEASFRNPGHAWVERDASRNLRLSFEPDRTIQYAVTYGTRPIADLEPGDVAEARTPAGSAALRSFALSQLGGIEPAANPEAAAREIEAVLRSWTYELDLQPRGPNAVEDFVLNRRKGHCQTFATAMALLLREVGVPTRFVTGFLGGELGAFGKYVLVRGQNVHAWVEVWCGPARGWVTFDPTPSIGQPGLETVPLAQRLRQVTDGLEFFYDRFVLSFGQGDQAELLRKLREAGGGALSALRRAGAGLSPFLRRLPAAALVAALLLVLFLIVLGRRGLGVSWKTRGLAPASAAYRRLQKALHRLGAPLTPASVPAETLAAAATLGPAAARPAEAIVRAYVRESFGGLEPAPGEEGRLRALLDEFRGAAGRSR